MIPKERMQFPLKAIFLKLKKENVCLKKIPIKVFIGILYAILKAIIS